MAQLITSAARSTPRFPPLPRVGLLGIDVSGLQLAAALQPHRHVTYAPPLQPSPLLPLQKALSPIDPHKMATALKQITGSNTGAVALGLPITGLVVGAAPYSRKEPRQQRIARGTVDFYRSQNIKAIDYNLTVLDHDDPVNPSTLYLALPKLRYIPIIEVLRSLHLEIHLTTFTALAQARWRHYSSALQTAAYYLVIGWRDTSLILLDGEGRLQYIRSLSIAGNIFSILTELSQIRQITVKALLEHIGNSLSIAPPTASEPLSASLYQVLQQEARNISQGLKAVINQQASGSTTLLPIDSIHLLFGAHRIDHLAEWLSLDLQVPVHEDPSGLPTLPRMADSASFAYAGALALTNLARSGKGAA